MSSLNRRRFLVAAAASSAGIAAGGWDRARPRHNQNCDWPVIRRTTFALGTEVSITVRHSSPQVADQAIEEAFAELSLVEQLMSIYRPESQLSTLNRDGRFEAPHPYLLQVLREAADVSQKTDGAFDVTVQPLWEAFADAEKIQRVPSVATTTAAQAKVDWRKLCVTGQAIYFQQPGMKATLNGIAQGFATDRVMAVLRERGIDHALVNAGELDSIGLSERGETWRVGVQHPRNETAYIALADLDGRALSTSGDYATRFSADSRHNHILDPHTGYSPTELASVSVVAPTATLADAASTACFVLGVDSSLAFIRSLSGVDAFFVLKDGETVCTGGFPLRNEQGAA